MSDTTLDSEEPLDTVDQDVDDEDYGEAGDFEGIDEDIIVADEMTIEDFLILEAVEFDSKDTEYIEWQSELTLAPFPIDSVADLKKLINEHPSFWVSAKLPSFLKDHIISTLKLTAPAPPPVVEERPKSKFFVQRPRRSTTISSMVLDILGDDNSKHIKSEIASIMRQGRPDLSDGADNLDMDRIGFTIKDDEILSDKPQHIEMKYGSSLLEEEVIWMDRVLELSQRRHYYTVARLYLSKMGQTNWEYTGLVGGCCIVTESNLQMISAHYIRIVDLEAWNPNRSLMFEIELYPNFKYTKATPFFHTFEITDYVAGLSFPDEAEAEEFFLKVSLCCEIPAKKMIEEEWASKEQSFCRVGDSKINVGHGLSKEVREKYADGGITDGTEVGWKKPAVPVELRGLVGPPVDAPAETDGVIDLFSPNFKRPEINRRQSLQLGASPTLFSEGNQQIADGISMAWRKNTKSLTEDEEKPVDTLQAELEAIQNRMNRLQEMRKVAKQTGDRQMAEQFKRQVTDLRHQYRQMSSQRNGERRKTFLSFTGKKKT